MRHKTKSIGIFAILPLFMIALSSNFIGNVEAYQQSGKLEATPDTFFIKDNLTRAIGEKFYGGDVYGDFILQVDTHNVKLFTSIKDPALFGKNLDIWVLDFGEKKWLKVGKFNGIKGEHNFSVESWVYEIIIISEKTDGNMPKMIVGGASLDKSEKHKTCKCS